MTTVTFNPKGLIISALGALVLWAALRTGSGGDLDIAVRVAVWTVYIVLSGVGIVAATRHGAPLSQQGAFRELRRWFTHR